MLQKQLSYPTCALHHVVLCDACRAAARLTAAVIKLQARWRGKLQRRAYLQALQRIVLLQAAFRGYPVRMQFLQSKGAAIWIQSCWRRHQAQGLLLQIKV